MRRLGPVLGPSLRVLLATQLVFPAPALAALESVDPRIDPILFETAPDVASRVTQPIDEPVFKLERGRSLEDINVRALSKEDQEKFFLEEKLAREGAQAMAASGGGGTAEGSLGDDIGTTPFAGLASAPEANLYSGTVSMSVPILIPPGRKNTTPDIKLTYSSAAGPGPFGFGWTVPTGSIERSTKFGAPDCTMDETDSDADFVLHLNGSTLELIQDPTIPDLFRPQLDEAYAEATASRASNHWTLRDRAGNTYYFGLHTTPVLTRVNTGADVFYDDNYPGTGCEFTSIWLLNVMIDPNGNRISYAYDVQGGTPYLTGISYGHNPAQGISQAPFWVVFISEDRPYSRVSFHKGLRQDLDRRVRQILVRYMAAPGGSYSLIRYYDLSYTDDAYTGRTLLESVRVRAPSGQDLLPPQTFQYASSELELGDTTTASPTGDDWLRKVHDDLDVSRTLMDIDGDGYTDLVRVNNSSTWTVFPGGENGISSTSHTFGVTGITNPHEIRTSNPPTWIDGEQDTFDITGDGVPDYVDADSYVSVGKWRVFEGSCSGAPATGACGFSSSASLWTAPGWGEPGTDNDEWKHTRVDESHSNNVAIWKDMIDMNGDGLVDVVAKDRGQHASAPWRVFRNNGADGFQEVDFGGTDWHLSYRSKSGNWHTDRAIFDANGDGLPDLVLFVWNHHVVFDASGAIVYDGPLSWCSGFFGSHPCSMLTTYKPTQGFVHAYKVVVRPNNGRGFDHSNEYYWYPPIGTTQSPIIPDIIFGDTAGIRISDTQSESSTVQDYVDLNGDGLPDLVLARGSDWKVYYNQGGFISASTSPVSLIPVAGPVSKAGLKTRVEVTDWNGDGLLDWVDTRAGATWTVQRARTVAGDPLVRPGLLVEADSGIGRVTNVEYTPSSRYDNVDVNGAPQLSSVTWVVSAIRHSDGLCDPGSGSVFYPASNPCIANGHENITYFDYEGGLFDADDREFRGFERVIASDPVDNRTETTFLQEWETKGKKAQEEVLADTEVLTRESFRWETKMSLGRTQVYLAEQMSEELSVDLGPGYDPSLDRCLLNRNEPPDDYGRILTTCSLSCGGSYPPFSVTNTCSGEIAGQVNTHTDWANPSGSWTTRERPSHVETEYHDGTGLATLTEKWFDYDGLANGAVEQGNATRVETFLDQSYAGSATNPVATNQYDVYGNLTVATDPRNCDTSSDYSTSPWNLYPASESNCLGHAVSMVTDLRYGKPSQVTDPNNQITEYLYDELGREIRTAQPLDDISGCGGGAFTCTTETDYVLGDPNSVTFEGRLTAVVTRAREPNGDGSPGTPSPSDFVESVEFVDALGRARARIVERVIDGDDDPTPVVHDQVEFDEVGNPITVYAPYVLAGSLPESPGGAITATSYLLNGNSSSVVDPLGRPYRVTPPDGHPLTSRYQGRLTEVLDPSGYTHGTSGVESLTDDFGREIRKVLLDSGVEKIRFDYVFDGLDRVLSTEISGNANTEVINEYDTLGRLVSVSDPDLGNATTAGFVRLGYDANGNLTYRDTPKASERVQWCYDALDRPTKRFLLTDADAYDSELCGSAATPESSYVYDDALAGLCFVGQLYQAVDSSGNEKFEYDERCRVTKQTKRIASKTAEMVFEYDLADHVTQLTYPDGEVVSYAYNRVGAVTSVVGDDVYLQDLEYEFLGRPARIQHGNQSGGDYAEDSLAYWGATESFRLKEIRTTRGSDTHYHVDYSYNDVGKIAAIADQAYGATSELSNGHIYSYDGLQRLTTDDWQGPHSSYDQAFAFDAVGNMTTMGSSSRTFHALRTHQITSSGSDSFVFDANGRLNYWFVSGGQRRYEYDAIDRLTWHRVNIGQVTDTYFKYDYADRRVSSHNGSEATRIRHYFQYAVAQGGELTKYYFAGDLMIAGRVVTAPEFSDVAVPFRGIEVPPWAGWGFALVVSMMLLAPALGRKRWDGALVPVRAVGVIIVFSVALLPPGLAKADLTGGVSLWHYHLDHLGSPQVISDDQGDLYRHSRYLAYGEVRHYDGPGTPVGPQAELRHEFTGYQRELTTGLLYAQARYYVPNLGLFLTHDPQDQFASPFGYANEDPVNLSDPTGEIVWAPILIGAALGAIVSAGATAIMNPDATALDILAAGATGAALGAAGGFAFQPLVVVEGVWTATAAAQLATGTALTGYSGYGSYEAFAAGDHVVGAISIAATVAGAGTLGRNIGRAVSGNPGGVARSARTTSQVKAASDNPRPEVQAATRTEQAPAAATGGPSNRSTLHERGFRPPAGTRSVPEGVPETWRIRPTSGEGGVRYFDPQNSGNAVRVMPGNPNSPYPNSRAPYVRWQRNGQALDVGGNVVPRNSPEAHIPLQNFRFDPSLFK